jgi:hypothetical protein
MIHKNLKEDGHVYLKTTALFITTALHFLAETKKNHEHLSE